MTITVPTVWYLARIAGCGDPYSATSPGAEWLCRFPNAAQEILDYAQTDSDAQDAIREQADSLVPVYTRELWNTFVDVAAYDEDVSDFGPIDAMENAAHVALYMIGERLLSSLIEAARESADEDERWAE